MAVPRNRSSNARKNSRKAHFAKKKVMTAICFNCKTSIMPHRLCPSCGYYGKKEVVKNETQQQEEE
jgi:large subunit ribosomal protein L32